METTDSVGANTNAMVPTWSPKESAAKRGLIRRERRGNVVTLRKDDGACLQWRRRVGKNRPSGRTVTMQIERDAFAEAPTGALGDEGVKWTLQERARPRWHAANGTKNRTALRGDDEKRLLLPATVNGSPFAADDDDHSQLRLASITE
uniref:Uncharacterized protein n=1 Tax=Trichuris muris TaxID=70415 RepID=A0A5S6Q1W9_TRIMR